MATALRTIEFLGLSVWLGSDIFLSFVVAPGAFTVLSSRDQAGALVGYSLTSMHLLGILCGLVILASRLLRMRTPTSFAAPVGLCVVLMMLLTTVSQIFVTPRMAELRAQMGPQFQAANSPLLAAFGRLHAVSVSLEGGVLLAGMAAMYLMVRELAPVQR